MAWMTTQLAKLKDRYGDQPLGGYIAAMGTYSAAVLVAAVSARAGGEEPSELRATDVALLTGATFGLSRLLAKDAVTSPIRAPFTRFERPAGAAEVNEEVTAHGAMHAVGELISCPFCLSVWIASALGTGLVFAPRTTRLVAGVFTAVAGANVLQLGYDAAKKASGNDGH
jgi:hypothetical protein